MKNVYSFTYSGRDRSIWIPESPNDWFSDGLTRPSQLKIRDCWRWNQGPCVVVRWARSQRSGILDFRLVCAVVVYWQAYGDQAKEVKSYISNINVSRKKRFGPLFTTMNGYVWTFILWITTAVYQANGETGKDAFCCRSRRSFHTGFFLLWFVNSWLSLTSSVIGLPVELLGFLTSEYGFDWF